MQAKSALKCKSLGKEIKNCDIEKWNQVAAEKCYPGILSKFQQNTDIASFLKNTGTKMILECCYNEVWGNGLPLSNPDRINPKKYKSQGILGSTLEQVRETLFVHKFQQREHHPLSRELQFKSSNGCPLTKPHNIICIIHGNNCCDLNKLLHVETPSCR